MNRFSAEVPESVRTVLGFGFQQPVDDPKNFCYLWVLYGTQTYQMGRAKLDLHQLFFLEKSHIENFGFIYSVSALVIGLYEDISVGVPTYLETCFVCNSEST